jgi:peptidoglycan-N-acetylglucosamine deacetylase
MTQVANLSIDLDNKWAYLRSSGHKDWETINSYLPLVVPRIVETLGEIGLPLTVFVVGRDLENDSDVGATHGFRSLAHHEFANHSFNHLPWLHTMDQNQVEFEIDRTSELIEQRLGQRPLGFRGPGFSCPDSVLRILASRGFVYDASSFPTSIAPIARMAFMMRSNLDEEQRKQASQLYGGWTSAFKPNRPYQRSVEGRSLWEFPVTVMPLARTPIHFSYFTFLAGFSKLAAKMYFRKAMLLCRLTGSVPSLLLHPPDFLGREDDADMAFFPGMKLARREKLDLIRWALTLFSKTFDVKRMIDHASHLSGLPLPSEIPHSKKLDPAVNSR